MSIYNNQEIKPILPTLNYSNQKQSIPLPVPYNKPIVVGNQYAFPQTNLPPLQFYSTPANYHPQQVQPGSSGSFVTNYGTLSPNPPISLHSINTRPNYTSSSPNDPNGSISPINPNDSTESHHEGDKVAIDYSSIINYTISPSLKRKRRHHSTSKEPEVTELPKLPCSVCGKIFNKPYNLKSHMKSHSTEKPFNCSYCSKSFARSHDKKRHELLHKGEKNFKCEGYLKDGVTKWGCGKKFARSDALSRHFRTETGWLCIKPLMDEAKTLESKDMINKLIHN